MTAPQPPAGGWQPIEHEQLGMAVVEAIADDGCRNAAGGIYATSVQEFAMEVQRAFAQQNGLHIRGLLPAPPAAAAEQSTDCAEQVKAQNASAAAHRSEAVATPVSAHSAAAAEQMEEPDQKAQLDGLKFDALGEPRKRYVRVTLDGSHCVMDPIEGDRFLADARAGGDESHYEVRDVWLSEREFDDLPEHEGF